MTISLPNLDFATSEAELLKHNPITDRLQNTGNEVHRWLGLALADVWWEFDRMLSKVPTIASIESGNVTLEQYKLYLLDMRQQVSQGGRWITRAASSMKNSHIELRNALIRHAAEEHTDFLMLEKNYLEIGGKAEDMADGGMNVGSQALSAFILHEASKPNPVGIFGATFLIEGLGVKKVFSWSEKIKASLNLSADAVSFLHYHGIADDTHYDNLIKVLTSSYVTAETAVEIRRIAKVVGALYVMQLRELGNY